MTKTIHQLSTTYEDMKQTRSLHEAQLDLLRKEVKAKREGKKRLILDIHEGTFERTKQQQETLHAGETIEGKLQICCSHGTKGLTDQTETLSLTLLSSSFTMNSQDCVKEGAG